MEACPSAVGFGSSSGRGVAVAAVVAVWRVGFSAGVCRGGRGSGRMALQRREMGDAAAVAIDRQDREWSAVPIDGQLVFGADPAPGGG